MTNTDKERADFEKLAREYGYDLGVRGDGEYVFGSTRVALAFYRAGREAERAEAVTDAHPEFDEDVDAESRANAALIVRAVNHFDEAVDALRDANVFLSAGLNWNGETLRDLKARVNALLSKLEAGHADH